MTERLPQGKGLRMRPLPQFTPKPIAFIIACLMTLSLACSTLLPAPTPTPEPTATLAPTLTATPEPTATSIPTDTPLPTATPVPLPTDTPVPPPTTAPEPTATPVPEPIATREEVPTVISSGEAFVELFDEEGGWATGDEDDVIGQVIDGVYRFNLIASDSYYWSTAEENFGNGVYGVTATAVSGPLDNGFGMMFMVDDSTDSFYAFEISSDGYVSIYYCADACETFTPLVDEGWFPSDAVNQGLNASNTLLVMAEDGTMTFILNDEEIGQVQDRSLNSGNIGILVETFTQGDVVVEFDDFIYFPLGDTQ